MEKDREDRRNQIRGQTSKKPLLVMTLRLPYPKWNIPSEKNNIARENRPYQNESRLPAAGYVDFRVCRWCLLRPKIGRPSYLMLFVGLTLYRVPYSYPQVESQKGPKDDPFK